MITVEYVGGLPGRDAALPVTVGVRHGAVRLKHGGLLGGWSCRLPLATIANAELATAQEARARCARGDEGAIRPCRPQEYFLTIEGMIGSRAASIVLRGPSAALLGLREDILAGRRRSGRQWRS